LRDWKSQRKKGQGKVDLVRRDVWVKAKREKTPGQERRKPIARSTKSHKEKTVSVKKESYLGKPHGRSLTKKTKYQKWSLPQKFTQSGEIHGEKGEKNWVGEGGADKFVRGGTARRIGHAFLFWGGWGGGPLEKLTQREIKCFW